MLAACKEFGHQTTAWERSLKGHCRAKRKDVALFWAGFIALSNVGPRCKHVLLANAFVSAAV